MFAPCFIAGLIAAQERYKAEQQELQRLLTLPPHQADIEIRYRQTLAQERISRQQPEIKIYNSLF